MGNESTSGKERKQDETNNRTHCNRKMDRKMHDNGNDTQKRRPTTTPVDGVDDDDDDDDATISKKHHKCNSYSNKTR